VTGRNFEHISPEKFESLIWNGARKKEKEIKRNEWSKDFDERPHHRGWIFMGDNLMWHRSVRSIAVGCHAVTENWMIPFALETYCFSVGQTTLQDCPFPWIISTPYLIHGFLGPLESAPQTASRSVQPFLHNTSKRKRNCKDWVRLIVGRWWGSVPSLDPLQKPLIITQKKLQHRMHAACFTGWPTLRNYCRIWAWCSRTTNWLNSGRTEFSMTNP